MEFLSVTIFSLKLWLNYTFNRYKIQTQDVVANKKIENVNFYKEFLHIDFPSTLYTISSRFSSHWLNNHSLNEKKIIKPNENQNSYFFNVAEIVKKREKISYIKNGVPMVESRLDKRRDVGEELTSKSFQGLTICFLAIQNSFNLKARDRKTKIFC